MESKKLHWKKRCLKDADSQNESIPSSSSSSTTPPTSPTSTTPTSPLATSQTPPSPLPRSIPEFTHHPGGPFSYHPPSSNGLKRRSSSPIFDNHPPKRPMHPTIPQLIPYSSHFTPQTCFPNFFNAPPHPFIFNHLNTLAYGLPSQHGAILLPPLPPQAPPPPPLPPLQIYHHHHHHQEDVKISRILIPSLPDVIIERSNSRASSPRPSTSSYSSSYSPRSPRSLISPPSNYQQNEDGTSPSPQKSRRRRRQDTLIPDDCPLTRDQIVELPIDEFNELIERPEYSEAFKAQCRDWRRKGKNRVAARKSREKRIEGITGLKERKRYLEVQKKKVLEDIAKKNRENDNMRRALDKLMRMGRPFSPNSK